MDEADPHWFKSSYSGFAQSCVEVGRTGLSAPLVRDTRDRAGVVLQFGLREWSILVTLLKAQPGKPR